jgi:hypothetical protein
VFQTKTAFDNAQRAYLVHELVDFSRAENSVVATDEPEKKYSLGSRNSGAGP